MGMMLRKDEYELQFDHAIVTDLEAVVQYLVTEEKGKRRSAEMWEALYTRFADEHMSATLSRFRSRQKATPVGVLERWLLVRTELLCMVAYAAHHTTNDSELNHSFMA